MYFGRLLRGDSEKSEKKSNRIKGNTVLWWTVKQFIENKSETKHDTIWALGNDWMKQTSRCIMTVRLWLTFKQFETT